MKSINTLCKTFNKQAVYISHHQVLSPTQYSSFIRPNNAVSEYRSVKHGELQNFDISCFHMEIPSFLKKMISDETDKRNESVLLYSFFHWNKGKRIVHGFVLADRNNHLIRKIYNNNRIKSQSVIDVCADIVISK